jgi:outer membrane protein assembly factor BamB
MGQRTVSRRSRLCAILAATIISPVPASAQQPDPRLVWNRVQVIDRMAAPFPSAAAAGGFVARCAGGIVWAPLTACIGEQTAQGEWPAAVDEAGRLLDDAAEQLVPLPPRSPLHVATTSLPVRDIVHERLSRMPPTITEAFRKQANAAAAKLIQEWRTTASPEPLQRVVRELGMSAHAREAADTLGDVAFEAGDFEAAFAWWNTKHADASADRLARRRAKQVLATVFMDRFADAQRGIDAMKRQHPDARGALAGRDGVYTDILAHWLQLRRAHQDEDEAKPWPTFAGTGTRNRVLVAPLPERLWTAGRTWRTALPGGALPGGGKRQGDAVFPVIRDGQVFVASHQEVVGHDVATGAFRFRHREADVPEGSKPGAAGPMLLHAAPERLFAAGPTTLFCLDTGPDVPQAGRLHWRVSARDGDGRPARFTTAPLVVGNRVFAVVSTTAGVRAEHHLACYTTRRGVLLWCVPLFEGPADSDRPKLLTWAGDRIVYATHQGQVIAADPATGQPLWAVRYPSHAVQSAALDPLPAVYDAGHIVVAPRDARLLLCIEAATGRVAWELPATDIKSIAGITDDMAIFTTRQGIEAVDIQTGGGALRWRQPGSGRLPTAGRSLLAGPLVYWPTHDERLPLRTLSFRTGSSAADDFTLRLDPSRLHGLPGGNFAFGERSLAIATRDELIVFTPRQATSAAAE